MRKYLTVSLINMAAMLNKINFMHLCYSLMPVLQGISSIKDVFFLPFQSKVQVGPKLKGLTSENKIGTKPQVG